MDEAELVAAERRHAEGRRRLGQLLWIDVPGAVMAGIRAKWFTRPEAMACAVESGRAVLVRAFLAQARAPRKKPFKLDFYRCPSEFAPDDWRRLHRLNWIGAEWAVRCLYQAPSRRVFDVLWELYGAHAEIGDLEHWAVQCVEWLIEAAPRRVEADLDECDLGAQNACNQVLVLRAAAEERLRADRISAYNRAIMATRPGDVPRPTQAHYAWWISGDPSTPVPVYDHQLRLMKLISVTGHQRAARFGLGICAFHIARTGRWELLDVCSYGAVAQRFIWACAHDEPDEAARLLRYMHARWSAPDRWHLDGSWRAALYALRVVAPLVEPDVRVRLHVPGDTQSVRAAHDLVVAALDADRPVRVDVDDHLDDAVADVVCTAYGRICGARRAAARTLACALRAAHPRLSDALADYLLDRVVRPPRLAIWARDRPVCGAAP